MANTKKYEKGTVKYTIRIPADKVEEAKKAIREALKQFQIKR